jgi:hypothetical protein
MRWWCDRRSRKRNTDASQARPGIASHNVSSSVVASSASETPSASPTTYRMSARAPMRVAGAVCSIASRAARPKINLCPLLSESGHWPAHPSRHPDQTKGAARRRAQDDHGGGYDAPGRLVLYLAVEGQIMRPGAAHVLPIDCPGGCQSSQSEKLRAKAAAPHRRQRPIQSR